MTATRKVVDKVASAFGALITVAFLVAGVGLLFAYSYTNSQVTSQLAEQNITFPAAGSPALASPKIGPYLNRYAGQKLTTGAQAKAWADHFIAVHLSEMPYGGNYDAVSGASMKAPHDAKLAVEVQTVFRGTTLRGLLLEAYGWWQVGQVALLGAIASFIASGLALVLTVLGLVHARKA